MNSILKCLQSIIAYCKDAPTYIRIIVIVLVSAVVALALYIGVACGTVTKKSFCSPDGCFVFTDSIGVTSPYKRYLNY